MPRSVLAVLLALACLPPAAVAEPVPTVRLDVGPALPIANAAEAFGAGLRVGGEFDVPITSELSAGLHVGYLDLLERERETGLGPTRNKLDLVHYGLHLTLGDPVPIGLTTDMTFGGGAYLVHSRVDGVLLGVPFRAESRRTEPGFHVGAGARWNGSGAWGISARATGHAILTESEETLLLTLVLGLSWRGR